MPKAHTKTTNYNLVWDHFKKKKVFIKSFNELKAYPKLAYFVNSQAIFKTIKFIFLVGPKHTPPIC